jgi:hypothetical protein
MEQMQKKLASLAAVNSALHSENESLRQRVEELEDEKDSEEEEVSELQGEFARRIGQADKQIAELRVRVGCVIALAAARDHTLCIGDVRACMHTAAVRMPGVCALSAALERPFIGFPSGDMANRPEDGDGQQYITSAS